jgi:hypothetical protein
VEEGGAVREKILASLAQHNGIEATDLLRQRHVKCSQLVHRKNEPTPCSWRGATFAEFREHQTDVILEIVKQEAVQ